MKTLKIFLLSLCCGMMTIYAQEVQNIGEATFVLPRDYKVLTKKDIIDVWGVDSINGYWLEIQNKDESVNALLCWYTAELLQKAYENYNPEVYENLNFSPMTAAIKPFEARITLPKNWKEKQKKDFFGADRYSSRWIEYTRSGRRGIVEACFMNGYLVVLFVEGKSFNIVRESVKRSFCFMNKL